jgi:hypothetical protein
MKDIFDIVKDEIIDKIDLTVKVISVSNVGSTFTIELCNNKWLRVNQYLNDGTHLWKITAINSVGIITATKPTGATDLTKRQTLTIKAPTFLAGTKIAVNNEWLVLNNDLRTKLPLIWLLESVEEQEFGIKSAIERKSKIRVLFLDDNNPKQYAKVDDFRKNVVSPMLGLKDSFNEAIKNNLIFDYIDNWTTKPFTRFGTENENGYLKNILDADLSGVQEDITLPIYKRKECKC